MPTKTIKSKFLLPKTQTTSKSSGMKDIAGGIEAFITKAAPTRYEIQENFSSNDNDGINREPLAVLRAPNAKNNNMEAPP